MKKTVVDEIWQDIAKFGFKAIESKIDFYRAIEKQNEDAKLLRAFNAGVKNQVGQNDSDRSYNTVTGFQIHNKAPTFEQWLIEYKKLQS